jgi:hypothetical protein
MVCSNNLFFLRSIPVDRYWGLHCQYKLALWLPRFPWILYMHEELVLESYRLYGLPGFPFSRTLSCFAEVSVMTDGCRLK